MRKVFAASLIALSLAACGGTSQSRKWQKVQQGLDRWTYCNNLYPVDSSMSIQKQANQFTLVNRCTGVEK